MYNELDYTIVMRLESGERMAEVKKFLEEQDGFRIVCTRDGKYLEKLLVLAEQRGVSELVAGISVDLDCKLGELPEKVCQLTNLKSLQLANQKLTTLPANLGNCSKLDTLNLKNNQLTTLPLSLGKCKDLETLEVDGNPLAEGAPTTIKELQERWEQWAKPLSHAAVSEALNPVRGDSAIPGFGMPQALMDITSAYLGGDVTVGEAETKVAAEEQERPLVIHPHSPESQESQKQQDLLLLKQAHDPAKAGANKEKDKPTTPKKSGPGFGLGR